MVLDTFWVVRKPTISSDNCGNSLDDFKLVRGGFQNGNVVVGVGIDKSWRQVTSISLDYLDCGSRVGDISDDSNLSTGYSNIATKPNRTSAINDFSVSNNQVENLRHGQVADAGCKDKIDC